MNLRRWGLVLTLGLVVGSGIAPAQDKTGSDKETKPPKEAAKPAVFKVEKSPFKIALTLKGVFETDQATEVFVSLDAWTPQTGGGILKVLNVAEHGAVVKKGDTILEFDRDAIDLMIKDLIADRDLNALAIKLSEEEQPVLDKLAPVELAAAERLKKQSDEDLKRYLDIERTLAEKTAEQSLKQAKSYLDNAKEELKQLEKMYRSKDLTEETEEIILKRQRVQVEFMEFYVKTAEVEKDRTLNIELPRRDISLREKAVKSDLDLKKLTATQPLTLTQKKLALAKLKYDRTKAEDRLGKLLKDREALTVKAPSDGVVYYGKFTRGQMGGTAAVAGKLQRGGMVLPDEVFMTIVQPKGLFVRATVEEEDLEYVKPGLTCKVVPQAQPDLKLSGKVESVGAIPVNAGSFEAKVAVQFGSAQLVPGMACTVKCVPYVQEQALTLPVSAVFTDELDEDKNYVYLVAKDGVAAKHFITIGKKTDKVIEIVKGLAEGQEVLQEKPKDTSKEAAK